MVGKTPIPAHARTLARRCVLPGVGVAGFAPLLGALDNGFLRRGQGLRTPQDVCAPESLVTLGVVGQVRQMMGRRQW